jgi:hypothetical protein
MASVVSSADGKDSAEGPTLVTTVFIDVMMSAV